MANTIADLVVGVRADLSKLHKELGQAPKEAEKAVDDVADEWEGLGGKLAPIALAAGAAAGAALVAGTLEAVEREAAGDKLAAQINLSAKDSKKAGKVAGSLYADAYGGSFEEVNEAVRNVVGGGLADLSDSKAVEDLSAKALDLSTAFDVDLNQAIGNVGTLVRTGLAKDATEGFDLITAASQKMKPNLVEELPEITEEYSQFFSGMGISGEEMFSMFVAADDKFSLDKTGDAIKELSIRAADGSDATQGAFEAIGLNGEKMQRQFVKGGPKARKAMDEMVDGLLAMEDPAAQSEAAIALFGTPVEDLGVDKIPKFLESLDDMGGGLGDVSGATEKMGDTLNDNVKTRAVSAWRTLSGTFSDKVGGVILPLLTKLFDWFSAKIPIAIEFVQTAFGKISAWWSQHGPAITAQAQNLFNNVLIPAFHAVSTAVQTVWTWFNNLDGANKKLILSLAAGAAGGLALFSAFKKVKAGIMVAKGAFTAMKVVMLANPFLAIAAAAIALVTVIVVNWDTIKKHLKKVWDWIKKTADKLFGGVFKFLKKTWEDVSKVTGNVWKGIQRFFSNTFGSISRFTERVFGGIRDFISDIWEKVRKVTKTVFGKISQIVSNIWNGIKRFFESTLGVIFDIFSGKWGSARDKIRDLTESMRTVISTIWGKIKTKIHDVIVGLRQWMADRWEEIKNKARDKFQAVRDAIADKINAVRTVIGNILNGPNGIMTKWKDFWNGIFRFARDTFEDVKGKVEEIGDNIAGAFETAVGAIKTAWDKLGDVAKAPVNFVIETVYTGGIKKLWDWFADKVGLGKAPAISPLNAGGFVPGFGPDKDSQLVAATPGEFMLNRGATKALGRGALEWLNGLRSKSDLARGTSRTGGDLSDLQHLNEGGFVKGPDEVLDWARTQQGRYLWGGFGPRYDCSGFMAALANFAKTGNAKSGGRTTTAAFSGRRDRVHRFTRGHGPTEGFNIGVSPSTWGSGHMAGTIAGTNVESAGGSLQRTHVGGRTGAGYGELGYRLDGFGGLSKKDKGFLSKLWEIITGGIPDSMGPMGKLFDIGKSVGTGLVDWALGMIPGWMRGFFKNLIGLESGAWVPGGSNRMAMLGEGSNDELVAPEPMLRRVIREESGGGGGMFDGAVFNLHGTPESLVHDLSRQVGFEVRFAGG